MVKKYIKIKRKYEKSHKVLYKKRVVYYIWIRSRKKPSIFYAPSWSKEKQDQPHLLYLKESSKKLLSFSLKKGVNYERKSSHVAIPR